MKLCSQIGVMFVLLMVVGCVSKDIPTVTDPAVNTSDEAVKGDDTSNANPTRSGEHDTDTTANLGKSDNQQPSHKAPVEKIAVLVNVSEHPTHTHLGTTTFNNFTKQYPYDWQIKSTIFNTLKAKIELSSGYDVVDVATLDTIDKSVLSSMNEKTNFVVNEQDKSVFFNGADTLRNALVSAGVSAVIIVNETPTIAATECGTYGCVEHRSEGYGLFTRSFLGTDNYVASASFTVSVERIDTPIEVSSLPQFEVLTSDKAKNLKLESFFAPSDFDELTQDELIPVKHAITDYINDLAEVAADYFAAH